MCRLKSLLKQDIVPIKFNGEKEDKNIYCPCKEWTGLMRFYQWRPLTSVDAKGMPDYWVGVSSEILGRKAKCTKKR